MAKDKIQPCYRAKEGANGANESLRSARRLRQFSRVRRREILAVRNLYDKNTFFQSRKNVLYVCVFSEPGGSLPLLSIIFYHNVCPLNASKIMQMTNLIATYLIITRPVTS